MAKRINEAEKEAMSKTNRENYFNQTKLNTNYHRYGLFSYAPPYSARDLTYRRDRPRQRDPDGAVVIEPRTFVAFQPRKGKGPDVYFSPPKFHTIGEPYVDPLKGRHLNEHMKAQKAAKIHDGQFRPGGAVKHPYSDYEYKPQDPLFKKVVHKDEQGQVYIGPRNFMTNPPKRGTSTAPDITLAKYPQYKGDDYESARKLASKERIAHHAKLQENPFKPASLHGNAFANNIETFGGKFPSKKEKRSQSVKRAEHDRPFYPANPSKKGIVDKTIAKFPVYMENPPRQIVRKKVQEEKVPWKDTYDEQTTPIPAVITSKLNLRKEFVSLAKLRS